MFINIATPAAITSSSSMSPMDGPAKCFAHELDEDPVKILDIHTGIGATMSPESPLGGGARESGAFITLEELTMFLSAPGRDRYHCRYIFICQFNSWSFLNVTRPMFDLIVSKHGISDAIYRLSSCFYTRSRDYEESFCWPCAHSEIDDWTGEIVCFVKKLHSVYTANLLTRSRPPRLLL